MAAAAPPASRLPPVQPSLLLGARGPCGLGLCCGRRRPRRGSRCGSRCCPRHRPGHRAPRGRDDAERHALVPHLRPDHVRGVVDGGDGGVEHVPPALLRHVYAPHEHARQGHQGHVVAHLRERREPEFVGEPAHEESEDKGEGEHDGRLEGPHHVLEAVVLEEELVRVLNLAQEHLLELCGERGAAHLLALLEGCHGGVHRLLVVEVELVVAEHALGGAEPLHGALVLLEGLVHCRGVVRLRRGVHDRLGLGQVARRVERRVGLEVAEQRRGGDFLLVHLLHHQLVRREDALHRRLEHGQEGHPQHGRAAVEGRVLGRLEARVRQQVAVDLLEAAVHVLPHLLELGVLVRLLRQHALEVGGAALRAPGVRVHV
mmetsp:Transcript_285/g.806  ORF Transcript_285/g.806 Transcript_285/m.806 type:complete len:373 (+) Transcript_285:237-1355(+)